jgi:hypothetical protein
MDPDTPRVVDMLSHEYTEFKLTSLAPLLIFIVLINTYRVGPQTSLLVRQSDALQRVPQVWGDPEVFTFAG